MGNNFENKHPRAKDGKFTEKLRKESGLELSSSSEDWGGENTGLVKPTPKKNLGAAGDKVLEQMRKDNPDILEGYSGPLGWTKKTGAKDIMEGYINHGQSIGDYERFSKLDSKGAEELLKVLPTSALDGRQNDSPTLRTMLSACAANPGKVHLSGYMIGDSRVDERITVDAILIADPAASEYRQLQREESRRYWQSKQKELGLDAIGSPDEVYGASLKNPNQKCQVMWWD